MDLLVEFSNVSFSYDSNSNFLNGFKLKVDLPESDGSKVVSLIGRSGTGKSTVMKLIAGILQPTFGKIIIRPLSMRVSYVAQEPVIFDHLTPLENARYLIDLPQNRPYADEAFFKQLCDLLSISDCLDKNKNSDELSGGERQRIAILQALSIRPNLLLLDEPCTGLDSLTKNRFLINLRRILSIFKISAIYITHHNDEAALISDAAVFLSKDDTSSQIQVDAYEAYENILNNPTTLEIAEFTRSPLFNIMECLIEKDRSINLCSGEWKDVNPTIIGFDQNVISFVSEGGVPVFPINSHGVVHLMSMGSAEGPLIATRTPSDGKMVSMNGKLFIQKGNSLSCKCIETIDNKLFVR